MSGAAVRAPVAAGEVLAGKYRVERVLGVGGMGVVVAAMHLELDERVAVKLLHPEIAESAEAVARFLHEGRAAVKIRSEHVAHVKDVGRLENGAPFMVMEHLEGEDVGRVIERGCLPVEVAVDYLLQAIEAIAEAHALGIVHRDLKPANLFVTHRADGSACIKVLDFGIAKTLQAGGARPGMAVTSTASMVGTPLYMSPEQLGSSPDLDTRADIWSLGVILFEMLTGQAPFAAGTLPQLCAAILSSPPRSLAELRPDAPRSLVVAVARCLEKSPGDRFATVGELAEAIAPLVAADGLSSAKRSRRLPVQRAAKGSSRVALGAAIAGAIAVGVGVTAFVLVRDRSSASGSQAAEALPASDPAPPAIAASTAPASPVASAPIADDTPAPPSSQTASAKRTSPAPSTRLPPKHGLGLPAGRK